MYHYSYQEQIKTEYLEARTKADNAAKNLARLKHALDQAETELRRATNLVNIIEAYHELVSGVNLDSKHED